METWKLIQGLSALFTVMFKSGQTDDGAYRNLVHVADETSTYLDPKDDKVYLLWGEGETELLEDDGEVKDATMQTFYAEITGKEYSRKVTAKLRELRNQAKQQLKAEHVKKLGGGAELAKSKRAYDMLRMGDTMKYGACYDGQPFFSASHQGADSDGNELNNQQNLFALALDVENLATMLRALTTYRNSAGENYGNKWTANVQADGSPAPSFVLYHGSKLAKKAAELLQLSRGAAQSVLAGTFETVQLDCLEGDYEDYWFVVFPTGKPLAMVDYGSVVIPAVGYETEPGRNHGRGEWIARAEFGLSYYEWHCAAMSTGAPA